MEAIVTGHSNALAVNPADEIIEYGPMAVRFLLAGENSTGSVAAFGKCPEYRGQG